MAATIDQQFIEYIVKSLVSNADAVKLERRIDEKGVLLELSVDPEDLGRVIGKGGATAQSLRTLLRALGTKNEARYNLKILDDGTPPPSRRDDRAEQIKEEPAPAVEDTPMEEPAGPAEDVPMDGEPEDVGRATNDDTLDHESDRGSLSERTRRELAELDDLDL